MRRRPPLIFLHVPKTAGTTLRGVLAKRYRDDRSFVIGNDINADIRRLTRMDAAARHRIELLMGHMSFGLHRWLAPGARYVTIIRDPVERVLSEYRFLKTNPRHPFHSRVKKMSLAEYLDSDFTGQAANGQTRLLCGRHAPGSPGIADREPLDEAHVRRAIENIDRYCLIAGTQEHFEESLLLMARRLGWRTRPFFLDRNVTRHEAGGLDLGPDARQRVAARNRLDLLLYRAVDERLQRAIADAGTGFPAALDRFVRLNRVYQRVYWRRVEYSRRARRLTGRLLPGRGRRC